MINEVKLISDPISMHIWTSLHNYAYKEAVFAAERLFAETKSDESLYLLASCLYRMNRPKQVIRLLAPHVSPLGKCRFLLSRCYFDCNMLNEAESSLFGSKRTSQCLNDIMSDFGDQACYAFLLLGDIYKLQQKYSESVMCYKECLKLNPFMWTAYENLCSIGEFVDPELVFKLTPSLGLITPTFTVIGQTVSAQKSPLNVNMKAERDRLGSRENVNPNSPVNDASNVMREPDVDRLTASANTPQVVKSTYISQCATANSEISTTQPQLPDGSSNTFTPASFPIPLVTPSAPLIDEDEIKSKRTATVTTVSADSGSTTTPSFGVLSLIPQSPLFACVPVFSRQDVNSLFSNSAMALDGTQPFRLALHQTALNRQPNTHRVQPNNNQLQTTILFNSSAGPTSTISQWRTQDTKASALMVATPSVSLSGGMFGHTCGRTSGITSTIPPWLSGSPISSTTSATGLLGNTSTPATSGTALLNAFPQPKTILFDELSETGAASTAFTTSKLDNTTVDTGAIAESLRQDSPGSDDGGSFIEPRTRAQKARAAAAVNQRKSPRFSRTSKASTDDTSTDDLKKPIIRLVTTKSLSRHHATKEDSVEHASVAECPKVVCTASSDRNDPRTESILAYLQLLRCLGRSFSLLLQHDYKGAVTVLSELPSEQLATGRTLAWAARAHVDAADYPNAHRIFNELRRLEPWQLYGMDLFSTVLWYQEAEHDLSQLANDLLSLDRSAPEPWSVAGNCFSLQREHDTAIRFFRRALQVCPTDAYSCTLLGHEYMAIDNLERAVSAFRHALRLDDRNYSARFGLSNVYFKQEYFGLADAHLVRALSLFPNSPLLLTHLGAIRARIGRLDEGPGSALDCLNKAVSINPSSPIALYHRACVLSSLGRYQDAIDELERLILLTPREAMIYFMLGHAYQKIGNSPQAMIYYSWSMELDPKGVNTNLRDIMANVPSSQQPSLAPFTCNIGGVATEHTPGSTVRHHRRGVRRPGRGRQGASRGVSHRLFLTPSFQGVDDDDATDGGEGIVVGGNALFGEDGSVADGGRSIYNLQRNRRRRGFSTSLRGDEDEGEGEEETMDMGE
uniref:Cell division cycle protein 27 homolog n=1 Tax=Mesocestoides corti TaxID=53468 RepID=A0A5K3FM72_MESCO